MRRSERGRLVYACARELGPVTAVLATAGEACFDQARPRPAGLAEQRLGEWEAALDILGVGVRRVVGVPDGQVGAYGQQVQTALGEVLAGLQTSTGGPVVLAAPARHDPHPDHQAVGEIAVSVAQACETPLLAFPIWMTYWTSPKDRVARTVQLHRVATGAAADAAYTRACNCFVSQLQPFA